MQSPEKDISHNLASFKLLDSILHVEYFQKTKKAYSFLAAKLLKFGEASTQIQVGTIKV